MVVRTMVNRAMGLGCMVVVHLGTMGMMVSLGTMVVRSRMHLGTMVVRTMMMRTMVAVRTSHCYGSGGQHGDCDEGLHNEFLCVILIDGLRRDVPSPNADILTEFYLLVQ